ncbi:hypothetical protein HS1genome_0733 [Sulfodiicoccus acidiphilus]|uniref:Uncharacterized protein n=1 Tax=Sulfodiicoccus acidiphilus TaxID=1670455 RepID=A0A348B2E2_9CREN|nr:hypothetical protein [Sulfodiicoccus acidiphilus]BBD72344.1 hypothetical protein HS1genome_0733 [Sulfodiicoccus acidiphilus]GGT90141.1 hypothetical protein GCM10007116_04890 [Sulfodiicoccus acidiphilus]
MRRNVVIIGAIILVIGVVLFLVIGPLLAVPTLSKLNLENITHPSIVRQLSVGESLSLGPFKGGEGIIFSFNDSADVPLEVKTTGVTQVRTINDTFVAIALPTASSNITLTNNYTAPITVYYSEPSVLPSLGAFLGGIVGVLLGIVLLIVGVIVLIVGFVLRPKA